MVIIDAMGGPGMPAEGGRMLVGPRVVGLQSLCLDTPNSINYYHIWTEFLK